MIRLLAPWVGLVLAAGCVTAVDFDPTGDEVSLEGTWQLRLGEDGELMPATAANCDALGVAEVQLVFFNEFCNKPFRSEQFVFPCAQGSFDTRSGATDGDGKVLEQGSYCTQYDGLDSQGTVVGESRRILLDVSVQDHDRVAEDPRGERPFDAIVVTPPDAGTPDAGTPDAGT